MIRFYIHQLIFATTAAFGMFVEHPRTFAFQTAERLRGSRNLVVQFISKKLRLLSGTQPTLHRDIADPRCSDIHEMSGREVGLAIQLLRDLPESTPVGTSDGGEIRPLMFLNNSVPFTKSGYTLRSQKLLSSLRTRGVPVVALTRVGYPVVIGRLAKANLTVVDDVPYYHAIPRIHPRSILCRDIKAINAIKRIAEENKVNVLHTTTDFKNAFVVASAAQELGIPWVYEVRGEPHNTWLSSIPDGKRKEAEASFYYRRAVAQELRSVASASAVIVLSEVSRQQWIKRGINPEKLHVVPNSIDSELLDQELQVKPITRGRSLGNGPVIGTVTSVVPYEGLELLLQAVKKMKGVTGLIVGDGAYLPDLRDRAERMGISDRIVFAGYQPQDEIVEWYQSIDVFVIPRIDAPVCRNVTPIKGLMAQALGLPVVASDLPALREVTGGIGFYFKPGDADSFVRGINAALASSRGQNAAESRKWASTRTWSVAAEKINEIYSGLLAD